MLGAAARGYSRGMEPHAIDVRRRNDQVTVVNRQGVVLVGLADPRARELGSWTLRRLDARRPTRNAPAFCRSGAGHPVWGREWCLDKGFGLGSRRGTVWSRSRVDDVVFYRIIDRDRVARASLIEIVGDIVLGRLALHALALGFTEPLHGVWVMEPTAPRILRVYAGDFAVAEMIDLNRDNRVDVLYVIQPL